MNAQRINVAIVTYNRPLLLRKCLDSVLSAANELDTKIYVAVNGLCPSSKLVLRDFSMVEVIQLEVSQTPGSARNKIIDQIDSGWICFLDDDVEIPENYFQLGIHFSQNYSNIYIFGGPDVAPLKPTIFQLSLSLAQMTFLTSAHTHYRHGGRSPNRSNYHLSATGEELILCNMWVHSQVFNQSVIRFPINYQRNEENVLIYHLKKHGHTFGFIENMKVFHFKKNTFHSLYRAVSSSAYYRAKSFLDFPDSFHPLYLIPSIFVLYLFSLLFKLDEFYIFPLVLYLLLSFLASFFVVIKEKKPYRFIGRVIIIQIFINLSYGIGMLWALLKESNLRLR